MSDWVREVEHHASCSVQYTGPDETDPLMEEQRRESKYARTFWVLFLLSVLGAGTCIGVYLIITELGVWSEHTPYILVDRRGWEAAPRADPLEPLALPVPYLVVTQTTSSSCSTHRSCLQSVKYLQELHTGPKNLSDIAYNFMIGGDAACYEGRGWHTQPELMEDLDDKSLVVALIGNFNLQPPVFKQIEELKTFIDDALDRGALSQCFTLILKLDRKFDKIFNDLLEENKQMKSIRKCQK